MSNKHHPLLLVVSAPSGAGKSSLCNRLIERIPGMVYSVSCTTRPPRGDEQNHIHYHFLSPAEFQARWRNGEFLECAEVHGNFYGTLKETVRQALAQGHDIIMDIDVQGAEQIRKACALMPDTDTVKQSLVDIFIAPPSLEELRRRLCGRGTDAPEVIEERMRNAEDEMRHQAAYRHVVVNDDFEKTADQLVKIICDERKKRL
jgi:guanylate kinase